ncbi:hypothetical protein SDC9_50752 [bioreactor metagenome]|uniref:Uncharacterized protein n=1 Tax=bioreactor metagenome TaxID=1076179 RepID=A0A644WKR7_9ZZZZ
MFHPPFGLCPSLWGYPTFLCICCCLLHCTGFIIPGASVFLPKNKGSRKPCRGKAETDQVRVETGGDEGQCRRKKDDAEQPRKPAKQESLHGDRKQGCPQKAGYGCPGDNRGAVSDKQDGRRVDEEKGDDEPCEGQLEGCPADFVCPGAGHAGRDVGGQGHRRGNRRKAGEVEDKEVGLETGNLHLVKNGDRDGGGDNVACARREPHAEDDGDHHAEHQGDEEASV